MWGFGFRIFSRGFLIAGFALVGLKPVDAAVSLSEILDPEVSMPDLFLFPREIHKSLQVSAETPASALKPKLMEIRSRANLLFSAEEVKSVSSRWNAALLSEIGDEILDVSKVFLFSQRLIHELGRSMAGDDQEVYRRLILYLVSDGEKWESTRESGIFTSDEIVILEAFRDRLPKTTVWTLSESSRIQAESSQLTGEISDPATIEILLRQTRSFRKSDLERRGLIPNFIDEDQSGKKRLTPPAILGGISLGLLGSLFANWWNKKSKRVEVNTWFPRAETDLENEMFKNQPEEWKGEPEAEVRERIRSLMLSDFKTKVLTRNGIEIRKLPLVFEDRLWLARTQNERVKRFRNSLREHGASEAQLSEIDRKIAEFLAAGSVRQRELYSLIEPQMKDAEEGGLSLRESVLRFEQAFSMRRAFRSEEKIREEKQKAQLEDILGVYSVNRRMAVSKSEFGASELGPSTSWLDPKIRDRFRDGMSYLRARLDHYRDGRILKSFEAPPSRWRGWSLANRKLAPRFSSGLGFLPGSIGNSAMNASCSRMLGKLGQNILWTLGFGGLGYALSDLLKRPELAKKEEQVTRDGSTTVAVESNNSLHPIYLAPLKAEAEAFALKNNLRVYFSSMTEPSEDTGLGSQIYVLFAAKSGASYEEQRTTALNGILIRFFLESEGKNPVLAKKLNLPDFLVPEKIFWKFDRAIQLNADEWAQRLIGGPLPFQPDLDSAKEVFSLH